jgi:hypothetical protein
LCFVESARRAGLLEFQYPDVSAESGIRESRNQAGGLP